MSDKYGESITFVPPFVISLRADVILPCTGHFSKITYEPSVADPAAEEGTKKKTHDAVLNFKVTSGKSGRNNDATFGKFASLYEGDKYVTPKAAQLQAEAESRKLNINDKPFKQSSPMKKSTTPGDWHGTISGKIPYEPTSAEPVKLKKGDVPQMPRGIFTSPAKKGTFGMNKFTLSEKVGYKGAQGEYEYLHDPESDLKRKKKVSACLLLSQLVSLANAPERPRRRWRPTGRLAHQSSPLNPQTFLLPNE